MIELLTDPAIWASFATLAILEIVLGIDNIIFLSIVTAALPKEQQKLARRIGLALALIMRIILLSMIVWIAKLTDPLFTVFGHEISWRDLIMVGGGLFLLWKGTGEIHHTLEGAEEDAAAMKKKAAFAMVIGQIVILDLVFSLDSVITAVGMSDQLWVMVAAVVVAIAVMLFASEPVSKFVHDHPTVKMLALSFILLVGMVLIAEGFHVHIERGYMYFAIAFSMGVEFLNLWAAKRKRAQRAEESGP
ncbi:MAG: TerC family protein [Micavibrio aeruginosavorus]|uniref:TerC family protein n=1 Tax=Micavibrio aeruginosavorus TaxID=349221 RepID=A0A7T5UFW3_9BACT|nr:MAG: TerC family protein [Micavibrio aeruginosavorus]